ncbi:unannotated protein [freshwater metagenome]|uniref:Unannotated protein n=1 Tax=freshwater metagenome TaxID=449393 RepID=A0A6J6D2R8_9ZZZZ
MPDRRTRSTAARSSSPIIGLAAGIIYLLSSINLSDDSSL